METQKIQEQILVSLNYLKEVRWKPGPQQESSPETTTKSTAGCGGLGSWGRSAGPGDPIPLLSHCVCMA